MSSPATYSVKTSNCRPVDNKDHLFKYADAKALLGIIKETNHQIYVNEIQNLVSYSYPNCLQFIIKKTKEIISDIFNMKSSTSMDFEHLAHPGKVLRYKLVHGEVSSIQCVYDNISHIVHQCTVQSVLCHCLIGWNGSLSVTACR